MPDFNREPSNQPTEQDELAQPNDLGKPNNPDQPDQPNGDRVVRLDNSDSSNRSIYDKLSEPRFDPESAKIAEEARIGTLDDNVDITDPDYDDSAAQTIESDLDHGHYQAPQ